MAPSNEIGQFLGVDALERHRVQFDLETRRLGRGDAFEHLQQGIAPGELGKPRAVECVERDIDPLHPRARQRLGVFSELRAVGGERQLRQIMPQPATQRGEQIDDIAPHQRLAAGNADLGHPAGDEAGGQIIKLLEREHFLFGQEGHAFGHAIFAAQVAAVGDRKAQIGDAALEAVDQRRRPLRRITQQDQIGLAGSLRVLAGGHVISHGTRDSALSPRAHLPKSVSLPRALRRAIRREH